MQRRAFGTSLKDRAVKYEGQSLFDEYNEEVKFVAVKELAKVSREVEKSAQKRREEAKSLLYN